MGGFGALHMAMRHPDRFAAVYALSPTLFDERGLEDGGFLSRPFLDAYRSDAARLRRGPPDQAAARFVHFMDALFATGRRFDYLRALAYAYAAAVAPAPDRGPPFSARDDAARLRAGLGDLAIEIGVHAAALRRMRGIALDIGRADHFAWIPRGARRFAALLAERGIRHRLLEHDGGHVDHLGERLEREALPFFARTLCPASG
jgi:pimeloyl-ACP methyl ester carboxylesterase